MKTWEQQVWHPQHTISLDKGFVSVDGVVTNTERENALAYIIMRLNAQALHWQGVAEELQKAKT